MATPRLPWLTFRQRLKQAHFKGLDPRPYEARPGGMHGPGGRAERDDERAHQDLLRPRLGRVRRQGQRFPDDPSAFLQPGHAPAAAIGRPRARRRDDLRRCVRSHRGEFLRPSAHALGTASSADVCLRAAGRDQLSAAVEPAALEHGRAVRLSRRRGDRHAHLHHLLRDSELRARARTDRRLRPAHLVHRLPRLLRLVRRHDNAAARLFGVPAA